MVDRKESAADVVLNIGDEEIVVESFSATKETDMETTYGSGQTLPDGYAINQISYSGEMTLKGTKFELDSILYDDNGIPEVADSITVTHLSGDKTVYYEIIVTSDGYEMSSGETTETSYEFTAMKRGRNNMVDHDATDA